MIINGKEQALLQPTTLQQLLLDLGYRTDLVAVEHNGHIIKQKDYKKTVVTDADRLEIVSFVGGG